MKARLVKPAKHDLSSRSNIFTQVSPISKTEILSGKYQVKFYRIPGTTGYRNFTRYQILVSGSSTSLQSIQMIFIVIHINISGIYFQLCFTVFITMKIFRAIFRIISLIVITYIKLSYLLLGNDSDGLNYGNIRMFLIMQTYILNYMLDCKCASNLKKNTAGRNLTVVQKPTFSSKVIRFSRITMSLALFVSITVCSGTTLL